MATAEHWRALWPRGLVFVGLVVVASWPWQGVRTAFADAFCALLKPMLEVTTFDGQANVVMRPLVASGAQGAVGVSNRSVGGRENIVADAALVLRLTRYAGQMQVQVSLRRDVYLPMVIFGALIVVAPLSWRRRLTTIGVGWGVIGLVGIASVYVLLGNIFSGRLMLAPQLAEVYPVSETWGDTLQFLNERWLTPPGNRVIGPVLLAVSALAPQIEHLKRGSPAPTQTAALELG